MFLNGTIIEQIITLYDQMPLRLSREESSQLMDDIEKVMSMYH
ncbi:hypothetical protein [Bacillus coreaensis]